MINRHISPISKGGTPKPAQGSEAAGILYIILTALQALLFTDGGTTQLYDLLIGDKATDKFANPL